VKKRKKLAHQRHGVPRPIRELARADDNSFRMQGLREQIADQAVAPLALGEEKHVMADIEAVLGSKGTKQRHKARLLPGEPFE
jgi:hypothetical protein